MASTAPTARPKQVKFLQAVPARPASATAKPGSDITPDGLAWLHNADDDIISCRGGQHRWPKVRFNGKPQPRGVGFRRQLDGCFQIRLTCPDCGTVRTETSLPSGEWEIGAHYGYEYPEGYRSPKDSGITRSDTVAERRRRTTEIMILQAPQMKKAS